LESGCRYGFRHLVRLIDGIKCRLPWKFRRRIVLERYFYDGADVIADYDLFGRFCKASYLTPFLDENLLVDRYFRFGRAKRYWYTQDGLGSVRQLVVGDTVQNSYTYTAWGVPLRWCESISNRYTFISREWNPEVRLFYCRMRDYAPAQARFLVRDKFWSGSALYQWCSNNPVIFVDPWGLFTIDKSCRKVCCNSECFKQAQNAEEQEKIEEKCEPPARRKRAKRITRNILNRVKRAAEEVVRRLPNLSIQAMRYAQRLMKQAADLLRKTAEKLKKPVVRGAMVSLLEKVRSRQHLALRYLGLAEMFLRMLAEQHKIVIRCESATEDKDIGWVTGGTTIYLGCHFIYRLLDEKVDTIAHELSHLISPPGWDPIIGKYERWQKEADSAGVTLGEYIWQGKARPITAAEGPVWRSAHVLGWIVGRNKVPQP